MNYEDKTFMPIIVDINSTTESNSGLALTLTEDPRRAWGQDDTFIFNSHQINPGLSSEHPNIGKLVDQVWGELKLNYQGEILKRRKEALKNILCSLLKAERFGGCVAVDLNNNKYTKGKRYRQIYFNLRALKQLIKALQRSDYLFKRKGIRRRFKTRIWASQKLVTRYEELCTESGTEQLGVIIRIEPRTYTIVLKDKDKKPIDFPDTNHTRNLEQDIRRINASNKSVAGDGITLQIQTGTELQEEIQKRIHRAGIDMLSPDGQKHPEGAITKSTTKSIFECLIPIEYFQLYRVFNNGVFTQGGRHYAHFQNLPSEYRAHFLIRGQHVTELDFSGLHTAMLYHRLNLIPPQDPYGYPKGRFERTLVKLLLNAIFNCQDKRSGIFAIINDELTKPKNAALLEYCECIHGGPYLALSQFYDEFTARHNALQQFFHSGVGRELQYVDSEVARQVMLHFVGIGAAILPVHDSFIVTMGHGPELRRVMQEKYQEQMRKHYGLSGDFFIGID